MNFLFSTLASFFLALAILIAVHEFGHFWVAKRLGVKILRFSIGFGPVILKYIGPKDKTEYAISAIPLGGYVKMLDEREGEVAESDLSRAFNRQPLWIRSTIVAAGPLFNLLFAVFAYWLVLVIGDIGLRPIIGEVAPKSVAEQAGLQAGDEFVSIDGQKTPTWENVILALVTIHSEHREIPIQIINTQGEERSCWLQDAAILGITDKSSEILKNLGLSIVHPNLPPRIGRIEPGAPADRAGLRSGDLLLSSGKQTFLDWNSWVEYVRAHPGHPIALQVKRQDRTIDLTITPLAQKDGEKIVGHIGATVDIPIGLDDKYRIMVRLGPLEALENAVNKTISLSRSTLIILGDMITGRGRLDNISGPLSIAKFAGEATSYGFNQFFKFLAAISISLGVVNLLPIPMLDGGHLLFFLIEGLRRRPVSDWWQLQAQKIGGMLLFALMSLAFYEDLQRMLE